ncbi:MAG TPA: SH3 domain-containing protein [Chloroflexota bacterium]|jgi:hypothetical protein
MARMGARGRRVDPLWQGALIGAVAVGLLLGLWLGRGRVRAVTSALWAPSPTPTPSWVGKIQELATPISTFQSRVAEIDPRTGRAVTTGVPLREGPGRGSEPTGFAVQPGERVLVVGLEKVGSERFFKVRSFDGLRRGWLPESAFPPEERPPG